MNTNDIKTLGIIGGMGPAATADFYSKLIALTPAQSDQLHIPVLIHADPSIPSRINSINGTGPDPKAALVAAAQRLCGLGAQVLVMPCNTAHYWYEVIEAQIHVPFLHIVDAVTQQISREIPTAQRVGLLATRATVLKQIYPLRAQAGSQSRHLSFVCPDTATQDALVDPAIAAAKAGNLNEAGRLLRLAAARLERMDVDCIVAACTEIPLVLRQSDCGVGLIDSCFALAQASVNRCTGVNVAAIKHNAALQTHSARPQFNRCATYMHTNHHAMIA